MSPEYSALIALRQPKEHAAGDMWLCRRLGMVTVINGHKRGQSSKRGVNSFTLYHWRERSLLARPCDWRDGDGNAGKFCIRGETYEYIGNLFEMLPYSMLATTHRAALPDGALPKWSNSL